VLPELGAELIARFSAALQYLHDVWIRLNLFVCDAENGFPL